MAPTLSRSFGQDLYSFAWAQAIQNKPLGFDVKKDEKEEELVFDINGSDREDLELEEGEIELGTEPIPEPKKIGEFDQRGVILEQIDFITEEETKADFERVCWHLQKLFASLKLMFSESAGVPVLNALVHQAFMAIETVYGVYDSGNLKKLNQNRELMLRLLIHIKNQYSVFLTAEQVKEIDERVQSLAYESVNVEKPANVVYLNGSANSVGLDRGVDHVSGNNGSLCFPSLRKVEFSPLLNLHAEYEEDSLPSPTYNNVPPLPMSKPIGFGAMTNGPPTQLIPLKNAQAENGTLHPYSVDAFQVVPSYQKKNMSSILPSNQLPSPTSDDNGNDDGGDDSHSKVSGSSAGSNIGSVGSNDDNTNKSSRSQFVPSKPDVQIDMGWNPVMKAPAKSRDPRLRFMDSEVGGVMKSRKHKAHHEPLPDGNSFKRQRNEPSRDLQVTTGSGGWTEDSGLLASHMGNKVRPNEMPMEIRKRGYGANANINPNGSYVGSIPNPTTSTTSALLSYPNVSNTVSVPNPAYPNGLNVGSVPNPTTSTAPAVSLSSLLKDPKMLLQLVKMEQQSIAVEAQQKAANPKSAGDTQPKSANLAANGVPGAAHSINHTSAKSSVEVRQSPVAKTQMPCQGTSSNAKNDVGRIRMKPRDPRRILHTNVVQKNDSLGSEPPKTSGARVSDMQNIKDRLRVRGQGEQAQSTGSPSQSAPLLGIAQQFTKSLKNVAGIVSTSQITSPPPAGSRNTYHQVPSKISNDSSEPKTVSGLSNLWGDVDHLLDGYDEQQKAAIQKERARRIAEQNKMFAEQKLCLVLDLDHTLLNSAKFVEVDPVHEEILRKKEGQDREKPERHLFRLQHLGMWTKLRPGIWNFLEKASKLFELHLYTMGNKLYATEMAKVLDPTGALFAGRVISKGDDGDSLDGEERVPKIKDLEGVLGMESAVVIIDDSVKVWPHNKLNLIVVERYTYFPCSRKQFGLLGPSLLEIDHDERPEDGTLASSLAVIEKIHENFFSHRWSLNEVDVRNILASEQRNILAGCKIVFSRVFPVGEASPHLHPLWHTAEQFGAQCTNQIDEHVTHVVANSLGTDKVNWALSRGKFVVHPGWVEASALLYRRAREQDFAIKT